MVERRGIGCWLVVLVVGCGGRMEGTDLEGVGGEAQELQWPQASSCGDSAPAASAEESAQRACHGECQPTECRSGPCQPEDVMSDADEPMALATDGASLYWATLLGEGAGVTSRIQRRFADGKLLQLADVDGELQELTVSGDRVYFTLTHQATQSSEIGSVPTVGGAITRYPVPGAAMGIAVGADRAYWADFERGVFSAKVESGALVGEREPFGGWINAHDVVLSGDTVLWTQLNTENSIHYKRPEETIDHILSCYQQWPSGLVAERADQRPRFYWINSYIHETGGRIMAHENGGVPHVLLNVEEQPHSLTGDDGYLYWVESRTLIRRMRK